MANDLSNPVNATTTQGHDGFFDHGSSTDSLFGTVQLAQADGGAAQPAQGETIHVNPPQGAAGPVVIRVEVTPGSIVELPQPFEADAALAAKEGDGNLAIRVGDVTVILQGYVAAANDPEHPVTIEGVDGKPIDIATILASTDPTIDIQTAAGPGDQGGQGADNTGAILSQLADGNGLGGLQSVGGQDQTELGYSLIDSSLRQEFAANTLAAPVFGFSVGGISGTFHEGFLRDPAQVDSFGNSQGTYFDTFLHEYRDAVEHPDTPMFEGWADFQGTGVLGQDFESYIGQTSQTIKVDAQFTGGTGDLVLTDIVHNVTSNGSDLHVEIQDGGHTMFVRRDEASASDTGNALVAVVHVTGPDAGGQFTIETILVNRIDHPDAGKDSMDIEVQFKVYDGPAPNSPQQQEGEGTGDEAPQSPSIEGSFKATFNDDVPILESVTYQNQHDGKVAARESEGSGSDVGLIDEDWLHGGSKDKDGASGDTGGGTCVTGSIKVNFGADGAALSDGATEKVDDPDKHAFVLDTAQYVLGKDFPFGATGLSSGGQPLVVLSVGPDHLTVGIADAKTQNTFAAKEGDTSEEPSGPTDPIPGHTIFTLTLNQTTGQFEFDLKGPLDHGTPSDAIFGEETGVSALVEETPATVDEETISLAFGVTAYDDDHDSVSAAINIEVNDDVPIARDDHDHVEKGSFAEICGNVVTAWGEDSNDGKDSKGGDGAVVFGVAAGELTGTQSGHVGEVILGTYGKLTLDADGKYTYTRNPSTPGGVDDHFTYTLKDGDGDTSTAVLTVHIDNASVTITLPSCPADTTVDEAGLPARNGEPAGTDAAANSETTSGHITIDAPDTIKTLQIGSTTLTLDQLTALTPAAPVTIQDGTRGELLLTHYDAGNGHLDYTYHLLDNDLGSGDSTTASFAITVKDLDGSQGDATLSIKIVDDAPQANCDEISAVAGRSADVQFIVDVSGSMRDSSFSVPTFQNVNYPDNGIGLERYAIAKMLTEHPEIQNVQIIIFDDHASKSVWMTAANALAYVKDGSHFSGGGNTDYDAALTKSMDGMDDSRPLPKSDQTLVYFFSDGDPNEPDHGVGIDGTGAGSNVSQAEWQQFVDKNDVTNVFTVGIGNVTQAELAELTPISYPNIDVKSPSGDDNFVNLTSSNTTTLVQTLDGLVSAPSGAVTGNVTTNDVPGADGYGNGKLVSISYASIEHDFSASVHQITLDLGTGRGTLVIKDDGSFTYTPPVGSADGLPFSIDYTIQDGDGDLSTAQLKIDLKAAPEVDLDASCEGHNASASFVEDGGAVHIAPTGTISDDGQIGSMTVTLTNRPDGDATEKLEVGSLPSGLSATYVNGVLTITGAASAADYQSVLRSILYKNSSQNPNETDRTVTVVVKDTEATPLSSITHVVNVSVQSINDAPTATALQSGLSIDEQVSLNIAGKGLSIADIDASSDTMTVKLTVDDQGVLTVTKGGASVNISGSGGNTVTITGSQSEINKVLSGATGSMTFKDDTDTPAASVKLKMTVNDNGNNGDGGSLSTSVETVITINNVNDKPETDLNGSSKSGADNAASFTEDNGAIAISPSGTVKDDSGTVVSMKVTLTSTPDGAAESLSVGSAYLPAGVTATYANGVLTIQGSASTSAYQTILQHIMYNNTSQAPNGSDRTVTVVVNDGALNSTSHSVTVEVNPVNDAPTANALQSGLTVQAGVDYSLAGKGLSIADIDAGSDTMTVTLKVGEGELTVTKGVANVSINTSYDHETVTITGSQSEINKVLTGVTGTIVYNDDDSSPSSSTKLTMTVNDNGNNGDGGSLSATVQTTIAVTPPNQKPETDLNGSSKSGADNAASFTEDQGAVAISPSGTVKDDSGTVVSMKVSLTSTPDGAAESLSVSPAYLPAGVTATYANGVLTISGSASTAVYQTILQHIVYNNSSQAPDGHDRTVTVVVNDGALNSTSHSVTIEVNPINDAPTATALQSGLHVDEGKDLTISGKGLSIADIDAGSDTMTVKLTVDDCGELTVAKGGANVNVSGNGSGTVTITGSQSEINKVLTGATGSVTFKDDTDTPAASVTLKMTVNDNGNNGDGGSLSTSVQTSIVINAINDAPNACDDNVYTNAGTTQIAIAEWMLLRNDSDPDTDSSKFDLISGNSAVANVTGSTVSHDNGSGTDGVVKFTDTNGNYTDSKFDYTMTDGSGGNATGHVTVHQDVSGTLTASSGDDIVIAHPTTATTVDAGAGDDIVVGSSKNDRLDGGADDDLIFGGGGNDTMIFGSGDKYDGGADFDRIEVTGSNGGVTVHYNANTFLNVEMIDLGEDTNRQGQSHQNTLALSAGDVAYHDYGTVANFKISLFVIGDVNGDGGNAQTAPNNRDNVDLNGFTKENGAVGSFTDAATGDSHSYQVWTSSTNPQVHVAIQQNLDIV